MLLAWDHTLRTASVEEELGGRGVMVGKVRETCQVIACSFSKRF